MAKKLVCSVCGIKGHNKRTCVQNKENGKKAKEAADPVVAEAPTLDDANEWKEWAESTKVLLGDLQLWVNNTQASLNKLLERL